MRKIYNEFFHIPSCGKIREKVMLARIATTVLITVFCLAAMAITAYAYFSDSITSNSNKIKAALFEATVWIVDENGNEVSVVTPDNKSYVASLNANVPYFITIAPTEHSTAKTGFMVLQADGNGTDFHTQQLGVDGDITRDELSFRLILGENTNVTLISHWGTSSCYRQNGDSEQYIIHEETVLVPVNGTLPSATGASTDQNTDDAKGEVLHTVAEGENLTKIAEKYNTTLYHIAAYNDVTDMNTIQIGSTLKIPPSDWEIPEGVNLQLVPVTPTEPDDSEETTPTTENETEEET